MWSYSLFFLLGPIRRLCVLPCASPPSAFYSWATPPSFLSPRASPLLVVSPRASPAPVFLRWSPLLFFSLASPPSVSLLGRPRRHFSPWASPPLVISPSTPRPQCLSLGPCVTSLPAASVFSFRLSAFSCCTWASLPSVLFFSGLSAFSFSPCPPPPPQFLLVGSPRC